MTITYDMRILQINKFLYPKGGAETYVLSLIDLLKKNNQEVLCFSQKNPKNISCAEEPYFIDDLDLSKFSLYSLIRLPRIFWSFKARKLIKKLIADKQPDIVHIHNIYHQISPSILSVFRRHSIPVIMTVHDFKLIASDYTLRADGRYLPPKNSLLVAWLLNLEFALHRHWKIYRNNIDLFITPSQFVKNKLIEHGFKNEKILVIPHFLSDDYFAIAAENIKAANDLQSKQGRYILSYGRLDESKGFDDLIRAFAEINVSGFKLKIAGAGPDEERLRRLIDQLPSRDKVELLGRKTQTEIIELIGKAEAVINCSKVHETFGMIILEAMALGKPIISSKVGAVPELITEGQNGLLYEVSDIGDLKNQLLKILSDSALRRQLSAKSLATAKNYTAKNHYPQLLQAYDRAKKNLRQPIRRINVALINLIAVLALALLLAVPFYQINIENSLAIASLSQGYPRLANLYWKNPVTMADAPELAKWNLLVLDMQAQTNSAAAIAEIRKLNPSITILAYTTANEMPTSRLSAVEPSGVGLWHDLAAGDEDRWHLKTWQGQNVVFWPGNVMMNLGVSDGSGKTYANYLVDFYDKIIMSSGLWDGLFFDNTWATAAQVNPSIDIDADGKPDSVDKINLLWQNYFLNFFNQLRNRLGSRAIIIGNGDGAYQQYLNGRMFEGFPEFWEGGWTGSIKRYGAVDNSGFQPRINIINSDTSNTGNKYDYAAMRFGLTSALLFNGYYSFDYGTQLREQLWWYDEYDVKLGQPLGPAKNLFSQSADIKTGVWQRDFVSGIVLVNSTDRPQTIYFDAQYLRLKGSQDQQTNSGAAITKITLAAQDGIILLKPLNQIQDSVFINGAYAAVFRNSGQVEQSGFFVFTADYPSGASIIKTDLNADGGKEILIADRNSLKLFADNGIWLKTIYPYGQNFSGQINFTVAALSIGAKPVIIVAPQTNGANLIKFFDNNLNDTGRQFYAYSKIWSNLGTSVAACDVNGDGKAEVITGAGLGGGPHVKIFNTDNKVIAEWFAYNQNSRGGVNVACGDIDNDGKAEVITGAGLGGGPQIRLFTGNGQVLGQWFAFDSSKRQGVRVATADLNADGQMEIITFNLNVFGK